MYVRLGARETQPNMIGSCVCVCQSSCFISQPRLLGLCKCLDALNESPEILYVYEALHIDCLTQHKD